MIVTGHTDRIGSLKYNMKLSERRAVVVKDYLVTQGHRSEADLLGRQGFKQPIPVTKFCDNKMKRKQLIECLAPNRRVTVEVVGRARSLSRSRSRRRSPRRSRKPSPKPSRSPKLRSVDSKALLRQGFFLSILALATLSCWRPPARSISSIEAALGRPGRAGRRGARRPRGRRRATDASRTCSRRGEARERYPGARRTSSCPGTCSFPASSTCTRTRR